MKTLKEMMIVVMVAMVMMVMNITTANADYREVEFIPGYDQGYSYYTNSTEYHFYIDGIEFHISCRNGWIPLYNDALMLMYAGINGSSTKYRIVDSDEVVGRVYVFDTAIDFCKYSAEYQVATHQNKRGIRLYSSLH